MNVDGIISDFAMNCKKAISANEAWFFIQFVFLRIPLLNLNKSFKL